MPTEQPAEATTIESVVAELHRRGVERGEREFERRVAEAREQAADIVAEAEARREALVEEGRREAERLVEATQSETEQLLQSFLASLPEMFSRRTSQLLDSLLQQSFAATEESRTVDEFIAAIGDDAGDSLRRHLDQAGARSFVEALLVLAVHHYGGSSGFSAFEVDAGLRSRLARLLADPELDPAIQFEFREGIRGFTVKSTDGREIEVSPESCKHMAEAWAGEEFREVFSRLLAEDRG
jgi:vacuolar-type H+-ATPase subunit H